MLTQIKNLLTPPTFEDDEIKTRNARLLAILIVSGVVLGIVIMVPLVITADDPSARIMGVGLVSIFTLISGAVWVLLRRGQADLAGIIFLSTLFLIFTASLYAFGGLDNPISGGYLIVIFLAGLLLGGMGAFVFGGLSVLAAVVLYILARIEMLPDLLGSNAPFGELMIFLGVISIMSVIGGFVLRTINNTVKRLQDAERVLQERNRELEIRRDAFREQAHDLERRTHFLETVAGVTRDAISTLDLETLLTRVVSLVSQRFDYHHAGIFLLDGARRNLILRAASSAMGRELVEDGYGVPVDADTVVSTVVVRGQSRVLLDVAETVNADHSVLAGTRSEILLPLGARGEVIGVLDVQSREPGVFGEEDIAILKILGDQIAVAISNARLFEQAQQSLEAERRAYGELSHEAWAELLHRHLAQGFVYDQGNVRPVEDATSQAQGDHGDLPALSLPIRVRGHAIGTLVAHKPDEALDWTADEKSLMINLVEQLSLALESARLYEDTQRRAAREQLIGEVASRMRETLDMETVMQTALQEIGDALEIGQIKLRMRDVEDR